MPSPEQVRALRWIVHAARVAEPLLTRMGIDLSELDLEEMSRTFDELVELNDSFNELFLDRGWVAHEWMNGDAARAAMVAARQDEWERADSILVDSYSPDAIEMHLGDMRSLKCFNKRFELARLAATDYAEGRYHACVPVVLALLDGMGQEHTGSGFLRQGVGFCKVDSFLEMGPGLASLMRLLTLKRGKTRSERIDVPYRHGILHGVDLGYSNRIVAAKAWAALVAVGVYVQKRELQAEDTPADPELIETLREMAKGPSNDQLLAAAERWTPRDSGSVILACGEAGPEENTPEEAVQKLLRAWQVENYGEMAGLTFDSLKEKQSAIAGRIRNNLGEKPTGFKLVRIEDESSNATWVAVTLAWPDWDEEEVRLRVLRQGDGRGIPRNLPGGDWYIVSLWPLEAVGLRMQAVENRRS